MDLDEKRKLIRGNTLISIYLFGSHAGDYVPVTYTRPRTAADGTKVAAIKIYRRFDDLANNYMDNFHNSFDFLAPVACKIAKEYSKTEAFSAEQVRCDEIRDALFESAYDPKIAWEKVVEYLEYKNKKAEVEALKPF